MTFNMNVYDRQLIPLNAMARRLRVTVSWLRGEAEAGRIPHIKADRAILVCPEAVEESLLKRAREGESCET